MIKKSKNIVITLTVLVFLPIVATPSQPVALAQSQLPPLESLSAEQNPFQPVIARSLGEIDTDYKDGSRLNVYISAPAGTGTVSLIIYPDYLNSDVYFGKSFDFSLRAAYDGSGPDRSNYYTVKVPVIMYEGVGRADLGLGMVGDFIFSEVCVVVEDKEQKECVFPEIDSREIVPTRVDITAP